RPTPRLPRSLASDGGIALTPARLEAFSECSTDSKTSNVEGRTVIWAIGGIERHGRQRGVKGATEFPEAFASGVAVDCTGWWRP
ncbi:hypothetical protein LXA35_18050, partial [Erwinia amylovora]|nr:hypothetical protein [Erwinia amylovora]